MKKLYFIFTGLILMLVALAGCGSGSGSTSGVLTSAVTVTDQTGGRYSVSGTAKYVPVNGADPTGTKIKYTIKYQGSSTSVDSGELTADGSGSIYYTQPLVYQDIQPIVVTFTASTGGLAFTSVANIPAISALSVNPQAVAFLQTEASGITKTVTVSGGFTPYTVASASSDIGAVVSGGTVTLTKLAATSLSAANTTVTVTDNKNNQQVITVSYFR